MVSVERVAWGLVCGLVVLSTPQAAAAAPDATVATQIERAVTDADADTDSDADSDADSAEDDGDEAGADGADCIVSHSEDVSEGDANTFARVICAEIRNQGVDVSDPVRRGIADSAYRIEVAKLSGKWVVTVHYQQEPGVVKRSRNLVVAEADDIVDVAAKLARSLVADKPLDEAAKPAPSYTASATDTDKGRVRFSLGVNYAMLRETEDQGPGLTIDLYHHTDSYALGGAIAYAVFQGDEANGAHLQFRLGGRQFFSSSDLAPFVGGGLSLSFLSSSQKVPETQELTGGGAGAYVEVGVDFMRSRSHSLTFSVRADLPFYSLSTDHETDSYGASPPQGETEEEWVAPLSASLTFGF